MLKLGIFCSWRRKKNTRLTDKELLDETERLLERIIERKIKLIVEKSVAETMKRYDDITKPKREKNPFMV